MKITNVMVFSLLLASCATQYHDGVSTWSDDSDSLELLETKEYNKYTIVEEAVPQAEVATAAVDVTPYGQQGQSLLPVESGNVIAVSSPVSTYTQPAYSTLDEINLSSAATRSASLKAPTRVLTTPSLTKVTSTKAKVIVDGGRCFANLKYPAKFVSRNLKDETAPQHYEYTELPAEYELVQKLVKNNRGEFEYKTVREVTKPAERVKRLVPAEYVVRQAGGAVYEDEAVKLSRVICQENLSTDLISKVQKALSKAGYATGTASGYINNNTLEALESYQSQNGLGTGALTLETLSSLGVYSYNL